MKRKPLLWTLVLWGSLCIVSPGAAEVFLSKEEALKLAFPEADAVEKRTFVLTPEQVQRVKVLSAEEVDAKIFTFFVGKKKGRVLGYAAFDVHNVRSLPEAFLVLLGPGGQTKDILLLAFYEPPEYQPSETWLKQFHGRSLTRDLRVGERIHGIAGSTLTSWAVTGAVRRVLALYRVLIAQGAE